MQSHFASSFFAESNHHDSGGSELHCIMARTGSKLDDSRTQASFNLAVVSVGERAVMKASTALAYSSLRESESSFAAISACSNKSSGMVMAIFMQQSKTQGIPHVNCYWS